MNKNNIILILAGLLILFSFIFQNVNITGYSVYNLDESFESGGRTIKIVKISQTNAVIEVEGVKNIITVGDYKIINGVKIKVVNVFFVTEEESRTVELSITVLDTGTCGDGECKAGETSESCCIDCGCPIDYICEYNECKSSIPVECRKHEDCDDGNSETIDLCVDLVPKTCKHYTEPEEDLEEQEVEEEIEEDLVEQEVEEKQGLFSRLINFLKNLF